MSGAGNAEERVENWVSRNVMVSEFKNVTGAGAEGHRAGMEQ